MRQFAHNYLELSLDYMKAGLFDDALTILKHCPDKNPLCFYYQGYIYNKIGQTTKADKYYETCPTINGVKDITISSEDELQSLLSNVSAKDYNGNDLEVYCSVNNGTKLMWNGKTRTSEIDFSKEGTYEIVYSTVGESNIYTREIATLHVK